MLNIAYTVIFAILCIGGVISSFFSGITFFAIFKHRKDNAPLTSFFLNKDSATKELKMFVYPALMLFLTGLFTFIQKILDGYAYLYNIDQIFFYLAYLFGIIALLIIIYISFRWFKLFRRFV
ncbi:MAG: hypothetical protein BJBARM4_0058 [Candidatus Parvarchaeum acidiphilum ARMAN-4]|jgi:heme/copper-type cytochrome/quinol oxidase subunit 2|uniref:Uncharacterized protein n=1 Tax=Candidatus Parvarchaeum acidiphilum ARMAN-4 TaxID=662760 RepID=D2EEC1_PARA4|nr:MAG: hypothetical protein BJBARM4_0058 [Candidatus Parvarchaeum acidiphilum ARMAN-4]